MSLSAEKLETLLRSGDATAIGKFFGSAREPDRRAVAPQVIAWCKRLSLNWRAQFNTKAAAEVQRIGAIDDWRELMPAAKVAALACASLAEIKALEDHRYVGAEAAVAVLAERRPPWVDEYAEFLCAGELRTGGGSWKQVRTLVKSGLCRPPRHENYVLDALNGVLPWHEPGKAQPALAELLLAEQDWLESDFWRLFEHDGNGEVSLASYEKYRRSQQTWSEALVELSQRGALSRDRLLDASLAALARDFIQFRAGWFSRFHEALCPTPAERAARVDAYLHLLASSIPPTVSFALQAVAEVDAVHPLSAAKLAGALPPVLNARGKAVVKTALRLLEAAATREPRERPTICLAALPALLHEAADVQKAVFDLLEGAGDKQDATLRAKVADFAGAVAASLKPRLASWCGAASLAAGPPAAGISAPSFPPVPSRIDPSRAIIPIDNLDDLIHAAGAILEEPSNPEEIERVLDGICRLCDQRPDDFEKQTAPLRKRALKKRDKEWGPTLERGLAMLVLAWLDGTNGFTQGADKLSSGRNAYAFLFQRLNVIGRQVRERRTLPLLSAPTHRGGWIEPRALVERWLAWQKSGREMDVLEQVVSLLRLAPEGRDVARKAARAATGEAGHALRLALGDDSDGAGAAGPTAALWLAAWRSRQPFGDLPEFEAAFPGLGPDAGFAARYFWGAKCVQEKLGTQVYARLKFGLRTEPACPGNPAGDLLPVLFHRRLQAYEGLVRDEIRWLALVWPANREAFFAHASQPLASAVSYADTTDRELSAFLEPLAEPHTELRPMACLALALGLAAQDNALRGHAQDALIAAIAEARLPGDGLGEALARLLDSGFNKFTRWAKSLREVARLSPHHARAAAALLTRALHADPARAPREIGALLELLFELLSETGGKVSDGPAREYLGNLAAGGKTARLARQLLALG